MSRAPRPLIVLVALSAALVMQAGRGALRAAGPPPWEAFIAAGAADRHVSTSALETIAAGWRDDYTGMVIDVARFLPAPRRPGDADGALPDLNTDESPGGFGGSDAPATVRQPPGSDVRRRLTSFLQKQTGQRFGDDLRAWRRWIWSRPVTPHPHLAQFKAELYARIDPRFRQFFTPQMKTSIRLDEVDWGGVPVNGIPPLQRPKSQPAAAATWLRDGHVVFGLVINGEARAYPRRILAWHEMAIDRLGSVDLTIVYCTLCGTVIPYESTVAGRRLSFGTSGLLYRSNKLMFDHETGSLWSALEGVPVVGPLVGLGAQLTFRTVVTTTWGEWRRDHPDTTVLSIDTGFDRDYAENAAYRDYFSHDRTMFETPRSDTRLRNKAEVVVLRPGVLGTTSPAVALSAEMLKRRPVFSFDVEAHPLVAVTTKGGANRVYRRGRWTFTAGASDRALVDQTGRGWTITPTALVTPDEDPLPLVATHRAFWFGWVAQHPDTQLVR